VTTNGRCSPPIRGGGLAAAVGLDGDGDGQRGCRSRPVSASASRVASSNQSVAAVARVLL